MITKRAHPSRRPLEAGFTLIEVLVATVIAALALVALLESFSSGLFTVSRLAARDRAALLAQSVLEAAGASELLTEGVETGRTLEGVEWRTTTRRRDDLIYSDPTKILVLPYEVEVEVAWRDGRRSRSLTLRTVRLGTRS
jgi:prepilin-type N-terminal cleavage/methylation domain-containing protein